MANELKETKILAKLIEGSMVSLEAKYHKNCMLHFLNRYRSVQKNRVREEENKEQNNEYFEGVLSFLFLLYVDRIFFKC